MKTRDKLQLLKEIERRNAQRLEAWKKARRGKQEPDRKAAGPRPDKERPP